MGRSYARMAGVVAVWGAILLVGASARAYEPAEAFIKALRDAELFDTAIDYLDSIKDNPAVPAQFKSRLLYERGVTLVEGAVTIGDPAIRDKWLDDGQKTMNEFLATDKDSPLALSAKTSLANVIFNRGVNRLEKSKKAKPEAKDALIGEARTMLQEAAKAFTAIGDDVRDRLKQFPANIDEKQDPRRFEDRARYRSDFLRARLMVGQCEETLGESYPDADANRKKWLDSSFEKYKKIYEDNRTRPAGFIARAGQGRCAQKLGRHKEAVPYFDEVLAQDGLGDSPDGRRLEVSTMLMAAKSMAADGKNKELFDKVAPFVRDARPEELRAPNFMELRLVAAKAAKAVADDLKAKDPKSPEIRKVLTEGRTMVQFVSRSIGPFQDDARKLLPSFVGGDSATGAATTKIVPKNFDEAKGAGDEAITQMTDANQMVTANGIALGNETDPAKKDLLAKEIDASKKQSEELRDEAYQYYMMALKLATPETEMATINKLRYLLCFLSFQKQNYYDAIVLGEFVARKFPQADNARSCAELVMVGYVQLARENMTTDKSWENNQIISICQFMVQQWPNQPESDKALGTLIPLMIGEGKLSEAEAYLAKIPADSDQRGTAELKLGQALWRNYIQGMREVKEWEAGTKEAPMGVTAAAKRQELEALMKRGKQVLDDGVKRMMTSAPNSPSMATAVLSLAQILVDTGEAARAVTMLEDEKIGPVALAKRNDPSLAGKDGYAAEAYRTALRAYITALPTAKDTDAVLKKADDMMDSLKTLLGDTPEGQKTLVSNYVSLARDLKTQMELADGDAKVALGKGFEKFLERVSGESSEPEVLNWVAETYRGMGDSFSAGGADKKGGLVYFGKSADIYKKLIEKGKASPTYFKSPRMAQQLQYQLALTQRSQLKYKEAMDAFEAILKDSPNTLMVQIEAAKTYQMWGDLGQVDRYSDAISGARKRSDGKDVGKNIIWGWGQIGKMAAGTGRNKEELHEARYNLALCRFKYAAKDPAKKEATLAAAKKDVTLTIGFYGDGGPNWRPKYDDLLKKIQTAMGQKPLGLAEPGIEKGPNKGPATAKGPAAAPATGTAPAGTPAPLVPGGVVPVPVVKPVIPGAPAGATK